MNYNQIKTFLSVAETRNYSQTAKDLFLAQSVVSYNIKTLEKETGITLFTRNTHEVKLTEAGEIFYTNFTIIKTMIDNTVKRCQTIETNKNTISIGFAGNQFITQGSSILADFSKRYPNHKVALSSFQFEDGVQPLLNHEVNFMYVFEEEIKQYEELNYIPLFACQPCILVSSKNEYSNRKSVSANDLSKEELVILESDNSGLFQALDILSKEGINIKYRKIKDLNVELLSVASNQAIVLSPFSYRADNTMNFLSIPVDFLPKTTRGLAYFKGEKNTSFKEFIALLNSYNVQNI